MFRNILVGVDYDLGSQDAFDDAIALAKATGAHLKFLHVLSFDEQCESWWMNDALRAKHPVFSDFLDSLFDNWRNLLQEHPERIGKYTAKAKSAGVKIEALDLEHYSGRPGLVLCEVARTGFTDLIAVGHRDKLREKAVELGELRLGSVSEYVLHHAPCSVLIGHQHQEGESRSLSNMRQILAAVDLSAISQIVLREALELARTTNAHLTVLHVSQSDSSLPEMLMSFSDEATTAGVSFDVKSYSPDPAESIGHTICQFAKQGQYELLLMGRRGLSGLQELALGSVSRYAAYHSPCAVLIVHPPTA